MLLAIDTSGPTLSLGLFDGERELASHVEEIGRGHAERLMPTVRAVLRDAGVEPSALSVIAVVTGPGSFMGLRVGIAAARAMALGLGIEAVGVSRMWALALGVEGDVHVVLDARRGQVFEQAFADGVPVTELRATAVETFVPRAARLVGSGAALVGGEPSSDVPSLADVAALARANPLPPSPIYGRGADAKVQQPAIFSRATQR